MSPRAMLGKLGIYQPMANDGWRGLGLDFLLKFDDSYKVRLAAVFLVGLIFLTACTGLVRKPQAGIVIEDDISLCLALSSDAAVSATLQPADCYSYREVRPWQQLAVAVIDRRAGSIRFDSTFQLQPTRSIFPRTPDCQGGGRLELKLGQLDAGSYQLFVGNTFVGQLAIPNELPWCSS